MALDLMLDMFNAELEKVKLEDLKIN